MQGLVRRLGKLQGHCKKLWRHCEQIASTYLYYQTFGWGDRLFVFFMFRLCHATSHCHSLLFSRGTYHSQRCFLLLSTVLLLFFTHLWLKNKKVKNIQTIADIFTIFSEKQTMLSMGLWFYMEKNYLTKLQWGKLRYYKDTLVSFCFLQHEGSDVFIYTNLMVV